MAETTTTRLSLRRWSAGTDTPSRAEFDTNFANLETLTAIDKQGTFASRPAAGVVGTYYWDTTNTYLWRDTGSAWFNIGSRAQDAVFKSSVVGNVPVAIDSPTGQTAHLFDLKVNAVTKAYFDKDGNLSAGTVAGVSSSFVNTAAATVVIAGKGAAAQSANLLELKNSANTNMFVVSPTGQVSAPYGILGPSSLVNATSASNVANHSGSVWAGTPAFEVRTAGAGTFNDFVYLKHGVADASAATRRLGIVMKVGDEDAAGAGRSAAIYLRSTSALFDTPSLRLDVRDTNVWDFRPDTVSGSTTPWPIYSTSFVKATPAGTGAFAASNTWIGTQNSGNAMYFRTAATTHGYYFYAGGVHSDSLADTGGGVTLMSVVPSTTTMGAATLGRMRLTDIADVAPDAPAPTFMIGDTTANIIMDNNEIMQRENGTSGQLLIQHEGGDLILGNGDTITRINDIPFYVSTNGIGPTSPQVGWLWVDGRVGQGLKRYSGSTWQLV